VRRTHGAFHRPSLCRIAPNWMKIVKNVTKDALRHRNNSIDPRISQPRRVVQISLRKNAVVYFIRFYVPFWYLLAFNFKFQIIQFILVYLRIVRMRCLKIICKQQIGKRQRIIGAARVRQNHICI